MAGKRNNVSWILARESKEMRKWITARLLLLLVIGGLASVVRGQDIPAVRAVIFRAEVASPAGGGVLTYSYRITNVASNSGSVWGIDIDISRPAGSVDLGNEGLSNGPGFLDTISSFILQQPSTRPMVPVGLSAPDNWLVKLSDIGTAGWGAGDEVFEIQPGQSMSGYQITSRGLPAIRQFVARPFVDVDTLSIKPPEDQTDVKRYRSEFDALEASVSAHGVTVAPTAPPADFKPLAFLETIQTYKDAAVKQGWIDDFGVANSLDVKLNSAQGALERQENTTARNVLGALLNEVEAQSGKHLSSEAVALLKFNTQYLISKIP